MRADPVVIAEWLELLHGRSPGRVHVCAKGNWTGQAYRDLEQAAGYAAAQDHREGVYLRCTTLKDGVMPSGKRGEASESLALPGLWADLDLAGPGHKVSAKSLPLLPDMDAARAVIAHLPEPTLWVHSGGGLYPWWLLDQPHVITDDLAELEALSTAWHESITDAATAAGYHVGGTGDLARVLRIPGTINRKDGLERVCEVIERSGRRYTLAELRDALPKPEPKQAPPPPPADDRPDPWAAFAQPDNGPGPFDALAETAAWRDILGPANYTHVGTDSEGRELWKRPEATSEYSLKAGNHVAVVWSTDADLPSGKGQKLTRGRLFAHLHHNGNESRAALDLLAAAHGEPGATHAARGLPAHVLTAIAATAPKRPAAGDPPPAAGAPQEPDRVPGESWAGVDLTDVVRGLLSGTITRLVPTIGDREGGGALFYLCKVNGLAGASGSGKSWTLLACCLQQINAGQHVIYVDLEDDAVGIVGRLLDLGADPDVVLARFHYVRPNEAYSLSSREQLLRQVADLKPTLVVIDSTGESMALDGAKPNDDDDTARWFRSLPGPIAKLGPAVVVLDHVIKADDGGLWPIGSQRKRAAISGAQYMQSTTKPFAKGQRGTAKLVCAKDRHGAYRPSERVADLVVEPTDDGLTFTLKAPEEGKAATAFRPTALMERVSRYLETTGQPASRSQITERVTGNRTALLDALDVLKTEGYVDVTLGPRKAEMCSSRRTYRQAADPKSDCYDPSQERVEPNDSTFSTPDPVPTRSFHKEKERGTGEDAGLDPSPGTGEERVRNGSDHPPDSCKDCGQQLLLRRAGRDRCDRCRLVKAAS